jgi:DNA-binding transcriptional ArsR family regulator
MLVMQTGSIQRFLRGGAEAAKTTTLAEDLYGRLLIAPQGLSRSEIGHHNRYREITEALESLRAAGLVDVRLERREGKGVRANIWFVKK